MPDFSTIILYVRDPGQSSLFYSGLLGKPIVESHPNFAMLPAGPGIMLGLWAIQDVIPAVEAPTMPRPAFAKDELVITVDTTEAVRACHAEWVRQGVQIIQEPNQQEFGFTFAAVDPDGHRLRVLTLPS